MTEKICENCGLYRIEHKEFQGENGYNAIAEDNPCKKFKAKIQPDFYCYKCKDFFKEPHNHSPQNLSAPMVGKPEDKPSLVERDGHTLKASTDEGNFNLNNNVCYDSEYKFWYYKSKDIKEFIRRLKKRYCVCKKNSVKYKRDGWRCSRCEEIDKLAGDDLK